MEAHRLRYRDRPCPAGGRWLRDRRCAVAVARGGGRLQRTCRGDGHGRNELSGRPDHGDRRSVLRGAAGARYHFEFSLRAFNPQCRPLWKRRRRASAQGGAMVPWAAPSTWGIAAAIVLQAAIFGFMHMNWVQGCYAGAAGLIFGWVLVTTGKLRYTILLHFAFNAGSYLMGLPWFVNTPLDVVVTVGIAGFVLVEAMRSLLRLRIPVSREADRSE